LKKFAVIVAGGSGSRMKTATPKQFLLLSGMPVLLYSLRAFYEADPRTEIIIALNPAYFDEWMNLREIHKITIKHQVTEGGETRFNSVKNALRHVADGALVAIHDGVRPLLSAGLINRCYVGATRFGNAVPATPVNDSLRLIEETGNRPLERDRVRIIQTPQVFKSEEIKNAYGQPYREEFTDDATVLESSGRKIHLVEGLPGNIKITAPQDLPLAESLLRTIA
jgi:2-C-methyl-D-erythritol 4-phosphate cytidylyltransferase